MSSEGSDSESGDESIKAPPSKTKVFVSNLEGFFQKYLVKSMVESGNYEISGSIQDVAKKPQGVLSSVGKVNSNHFYFVIFTPCIINHQSIEKRKGGRNKRYE